MMNNNNNKCELRVLIGQAYCPKKMNHELYHLSNRPDCGDDAFFVIDSYDLTSSSRQQNHTLCSAMGVADGVGSYARRGVDPSLLPWSLMDLSKKILLTQQQLSIQQVLDKAYDTIVNNRLISMGATTACLVSMNTMQNNPSNIELNGVNLGDSACLIIRNGTIIFQTDIQTHSFNAPYQLAVPRNDNNPKQNLPSHSQQFQYELTRGDIVIVTTDGLLDNLSKNDIVDIVLNMMNCDPSYKADRIAKALVKQSHLNSISKDRDDQIPFVQYAKANHLKHTGGKRDDITCCVASIV
jgi:protein phosphatase PTC7